jgi:hypothetical protein
VPPTTSTTLATTTTQSSCHPSYNPCLPYTSDVDCSGGGGDGPVFTGPVQVTGSDPYGLDRDGNGTGCETS